MFPKSPQHRSEAWRPVIACPLYEVSNLGRVRRVAAGQGARAGRVLKWGRHTSNGYPDVRLSVGNIAKRYNVHVLVAAAFIGPRPDGLVIRHIDGDKWNPKVENLVYGTPRENSQDDVLHGKTHIGERNGNSRLTREQVALAIVRYKNGASPKHMARELGVSQSTLFRVFSGKTWKHVHC